jgi:formylglycine-generating enzyme required for sulfatase activity
MAMSHEKLVHKVSLDGFYIDIREVTNSQFTAFVNTTNYVTLAERPIVWEEMQIQLPPGTPKPVDSILQSAALTFKAAPTKLPNLFDFSQWWGWTIGPDWRHPQGPSSTIDGKEDYPVVQLAFEDALAYCDWAERSLSTEAQWEFAARGGQETIYTWGEDLELLSLQANSRESSFPDTNLGTDEFIGIAPTASL